MSLSFKDYLIENSPIHGGTSKITNINKKCPLCNEPYKYISIVAKCKDCHVTESMISLRCAIKDEKNHDVVVMEYNKVTDITTYYKTNVKEIKGFDLSLFKTYLIMK